MSNIASMQESMNAHTKQFLIGNKPNKIGEDWAIVPIGDDLYLSHSPALAVATGKDVNGNVWHLLGLAVQTDGEKRNPLTEIENASTAQVKGLYKSWAGRWVLVGNTEIHMDCSGMLGCFYTTINEERWVSSSLALLQEIGGLSPRRETLKHKSGIEWYPLPMSRFEGVYKLLPSQVLNLKTFHTEARALPKPVAPLSYGEILEKLTEKLKRAVVNVSDLGKPIFIPLTAGYDSRLILAATRYAGIKAESYTTGHYYISDADVTLPFKLAEASGYRHNYIEKATFSKEKEALYDYHTAGNTNDIDRTKFSHGQWEPFGKGDLIFRGGLFEIGRCFYWNQMGADLSIKSIMKAFGFEYNPHSFNETALLEWVNWVKKTPTEGLDWRDRFYLEQRVAGWLSSIEQSLDLTGTERFYIVNCHDIISLLLSIPVEKRKTSQHHVDLIEKMFPALLQYPFNPSGPAFKKLQRIISIITRMPLPELYRKLKAKFF